jgi:DNA repair protein RadA/Sms
VGSADVFVNVVGGVRIEEPGADLAIALAVASAARGVALQGAPGGGPLVCFGELGLTGELRSVGHPDRRVREATKFGLRDVVSPETAPTLRQALRAALKSPAESNRAAA